FSNLHFLYHVYNLIQSITYVLFPLNSSAIFSLCLNRLFTPDFDNLVPGTNSPISFNDTSGFSSLVSASSFKRSGKASNPICSLIYLIFSTCLTEALIVLFILAVSQLTKLLTELRISLTILTSSNLNKALCAPIILKNSVIFSASFK